jgi:cytochrome P450
MDPKVFPKPEAFEPERWQENAYLDKYLVSFGKGTRVCLGMKYVLLRRLEPVLKPISLAYIERYLTLASVFRKFEPELYQTTIADVIIHRDHFVAFPQRGTKGVRALVKKEL